MWLEMWSVHTAASKKIHDPSWQGLWGHTNLGLGKRHKKGSTIRVQRLDLNIECCRNIVLLINGLSCSNTKAHLFKYFTKFNKVKLTRELYSDKAATGHRERSSLNLWIRRWPRTWPGRLCFSSPMMGIIQWSWIYNNNSWKNYNKFRTHLIN